MRAATIFLVVALLMAAASAHLNPKLQHFAKPSRPATQSSVSAQNRAQALYQAIEARASVDKLASFFAEDVVACGYTMNAPGGRKCWSGATDFATGISTFNNNTANRMISIDAVFPPVDQAYAALHFVDFGIFAESLKSYSWESFTTVEVDYNNNINRYFEFNDLSSAQTNASSMKQATQNVFEMLCNGDLASFQSLFTANPYVVEVVDSENKFVSNGTQFFDHVADFINSRVPNSCDVYTERIGVAGDFVFVERHTAFQSNLGNSTAHNLLRGVDIFRFTSGGSGNLLVDDWYFYGHAKYQN